jgi:hypothetical protein
VIGTLELRKVVADVRQELDCRVEQRCALDSLRDESRELEQQTAAVRMADPGRTPDPVRIERLEHVVRIRRDRPRWLPAGAGMSAEIGGEHMEAIGEALLGEPPKAAAVSVEAVKEDDRRCGHVTPRVQVQLHLWQPSQACSPSFTTSTGTWSRSKRC